MPATTPNSAVSDMSMSPEARARMRATERDIYNYYNDMGKNKGHCTWGAGILAHRGVCIAEELSRKVSISMIDQEFTRRVSEAERSVRKNIKVKLTQDQFDALCSLTYNSGATGAYDTYVFVNAGDFAGAADNIAKRIKVKVKKGKKFVLVIAPGLIKRREEESAPFRTSSAKPVDDRKDE